MKRKQILEVPSQSKMKVAKTDEIMKTEQEPMTRIANSLNRHFGFKFSDKKAKSNMLKGAAREPFEIAEKQKCSMLSFSVASYLEAVIPTTIAWNSGPRTFEIESSLVMMMQENIWTL